MDILGKLNSLVEKYRDIEARLQDPNLETAQMIALSKEHSGLQEIVDAAMDYTKKLADLESAKASLADPDLKSLAQEEIASLNHELPQLQEKLKIMLIPRDPADDKNVILEIRSGTGGEEAALFAGDLLRMYERYATHKGFRFELMELSETGIGGVKEAVALISGHQVFARMKFESGVHRVQRVPQTEASGRIHTSAATVAVLPEAEEIDVVIDEKDLRIDTFRAGGAGGQHVNKTESAIRITHMPSGIVVECQEERSQIRNKEKAFKRLRAHLYEMQRRKAEEERSSSRQAQVGSGDRSERIRTYNFPQSRVSDHRVNLTLYKLDEMMAGLALDEFVDALTVSDQLEKLAALE
ncbi:MAG: peptide chain release factor 1 [Alphaproteobacteria bacterium]|nr:peptide chain release factor 1 [Alphaproteobacteria bacterium]